MRNRLPVIVAVVLALFAIIAVHSYIKSEKTRVVEQFKGEKYIAARVDILPGQVIDKTMLKMKEVPPQYVPAQAVYSSNDNANLLTGRKARMPIKADQIILWSDLVTDRRGGFESVIPPGEKAFTVKMSGGIRGGLIQPSDHVDILASFALPETDQEKAREQTSASWRARSDMVNIVLLQNVTVLAIGDSYVGATPESTMKNELTVAVTLPEAQLLMFASQHGDLAAVLRQQDDVSTLARGELPRVTFEQLEKLVGDLDQLRTRRTVEILKGDKVEQVSVQHAEE